MQDSEDICTVIAPAVVAMGYIFWGCESHVHGHLAELKIYIDKEGGVTLEDCSAVSRQVRAMLAVEDPVGREYQLEVSSPGLDRPLFTEAQFAQYIGHVVIVRLDKPLGGRRNFTGKIQAIRDNQVVLEVEGDTVALPFASIGKASLHEEVVV